MKIAGSVALVTGGASGIGRSSALEFARRGADVVIADLHVERMEEVAHEAEGRGAAAEGVEAERIGPMVADAVQEGRFLLHTHPSEALHVAKRRQDIETALAEQSEAAPLPPKIL